MGRSDPVRAKRKSVAREGGVSVREEALPKAIHAPDYSTYLLSAAVSRHTFGTYLGHAIQFDRCAVRTPVRTWLAACGSLNAGAGIMPRIDIGG